MTNEQDQLASHLAHVSIGSLDDTLSKQLGNTHLSSVPPQATSSSSTSHNTNEPTTPWPAAVFQRPPTSDTPSWQTTSQSQSPTVTDDDLEGWGDAPAYTSILPYTEFGFTSIIGPGQTTIPSTSTLKKDTLTLDPNQPFSRYIHQPNGFASFASPPPPSSNNATF